MPGAPLMRLEDFGIDPVTGFLPKQPPLTRLPDPYYQPWELCIDDISHLLVAWKLRKRITGIPELSIDRLLTEPEQQRAFLLLSLLSHAYVWGAKGEPVVSILPRNLAKPWLKLSAKLGLRPISCHAALVYYNWRLLDQQGPVDLSNLATLHTVSGGIDESWFYLITIAIEAKGAPAMPAILKCLQAAKEQDFASLAAGLRTIAGVISDMTKALERMTENCDPYIFYHRVRIYFSGWSNMKDLPDGLIYEGDEGEIEKMFAEEGDLKGCAGVQLDDILAGKVVPKRYPGGSAAQSALIHSLDVFLGVKHLPTGMKHSKGPAAGSSDAVPASQQSSPHGEPGGMQNFLLDMRYHMPKNFRLWLVELERCSKVKDTLNDMANDNPHSPIVHDAIQAFDQCVGNMKAFRDKHIQIVARYIVIQSRRAAQTGQSATGEGYHGMGPDASQVIRLDGSAQSPTSTEFDSLVTNDGLATSTSPVLSGKPTVKAQVFSANRDPSTVAAGGRGTGGTEVMPFLKQSRDETAAASLRNLLRHKQ